MVSDIIMIMSDNITRYVIMAEVLAILDAQPYPRRLLPILMPSHFLN